MLHIIFTAKAFILEDVFVTLVSRICEFLILRVTELNSLNFLSAPFSSICLSFLNY